MLKTASPALVVLSLVFAAGCNGEGPTSPITFVGPPNLVVTDLRVGEGATLALGQTARVHYTLWLFDPRGGDSKGTLIEDSRLGGGLTGVPIPITAGTVIQGWVDGMPGMKVGGLRRLVIPPSLAFGTTGSQQIPPNSWLIFDIELIGID